MDDRNAKGCSTDTASRLTAGEVLSEWVRENYDPMPTRNWISIGENRLIKSISFLAKGGGNRQYIKFDVQDYHVHVYSGFYRKQGSHVGPIDIRDPDSLSQISNAIKRELQRGPDVS